jgi:hypothetical protein
MSSSTINVQCVFLLFILKYKKLHNTKVTLEINSFLLCIKKIAHRHILHGMLLTPAHDVPVGTHTRTYVFQRPPCGPVQEAPHGAHTV